MLSNTEKKSGRQNAAASGKEEKTKLLKTQKEAVYIFERLARAQERLVLLKAWKYGVKFIDSGVKKE
ncbi:hypothetical protein V5799_008492 [Amblyomma americanum]|uniref:Uncharacterized protein n=1 Tax=Amblyomma americanum TaxID=6943 RepID=A0AAQ4FEK7_AMBAM